MNQGVQAGSRNCMGQGMDSPLELPKTHAALPALGLQTQSTYARLLTSKTVK
jgi:hypothetical protein